LEAIQHLKAAGGAQGAAGGAEAGQFEKEGRPPSTARRARKHQDG